MAPTAALYSKHSVDCFGSQKGVTFKALYSKTIFSYSFGGENEWMQNIHGYHDRGKIVVNLAC